MQIQQWVEAESMLNYGSCFYDEKRVDKQELFWFRRHFSKVTPQGILAAKNIKAPKTIPV